MTDTGAPGTAPDLRCSTQSALVGDSHLGSAGHDDHYLLVELPLPWPKSIEDHPLLAGVGASTSTAPASTGSTRILAILSDRPAPVAPDGTPVHRLIAYRGGDGVTFSHFARHEGFVRREDLVDAIDDVLRGELDHLDPSDDGVTDVLICTHGTRDRCCGQEGARLFLDLAAADPGQARIWRTSHTGGHRFAPIALTFPDGYTWGRITSTDLLGILDRSVGADRVVDRNRGCLGFAEPEAQVADTMALAASGWEWMAGPRAARIRAGSGSEMTVAIGNDRASFEVTVACGAPVPVPACGEPIEAAKKTTVPRFVLAVDRLD